MAKSETLSTATKTDDIEKSYNSAVKAMSVLGLKMTTKKPNQAVVASLMLKSGKKAEFKLGGDPDKLLKLTVECDGNANTLGTLDVSAEKDAAKRLAIMKSLVDCGLATKADLAALEKESAPKADPKVIANLDRRIAAENKTLAEAEKEYAVYDNARNYDLALKAPAVLADLVAYCKKGMTEENLEFLKEALKKPAKDKMLAKYIVAGAPQQVNISDSLRNQIIAGKADISDAVTEVKSVVTTGPLTTIRGTKKSALRETINKAKKAIEDLEAEKKKLGAA